MKIFTVFAIIILLSLFMQNSCAYESQPEINNPLDQTIELSEAGEIVWIVVTENPDKYVVFKNGILVEGPSSYVSGGNIEISINTTIVGIWNYTIIANDTSGKTASDRVDITIVDNTSPLITGPEDNEIGQDGSGYIIWNIIEEDPGEYTVLRNGSLINSSSYQSGMDIRISVDSSLLGIWNYTIYAYDISGNIAIDQVNISIIDDVAPIITGQDDLLIPLNSVRTIDWHIIEKNPYEFRILRNGDQIRESVPYQNDSHINIEVDTSEEGISIYTIIAYDTSGTAAFDEVKVTVIEGLDDILPIITGPKDQIIEQNSNYGITWNIIEANPNIYEIKKNGVSRVVAPYNNGSDIEYVVETDNLGIFEYVIEANDDTGNTASDQVNITIQERAPPNITGPEDITIKQGTSGNIILNIFDLSPAKYWVFENVTMILEPQIYQSGEVRIPIDTSTLGTWNYTIYANDTFGDISSKFVNVIVIQPPPSNTGGSSGGSNGGGGGTGEEHFNIILYENNRQYVNKNEPVIYDFSKEGNIVHSLKFTGREKAGKILVKVEILNSTSTLVTTDPPDIIYKNFNLWCGFKGWFSTKTVADPTLEFIVERSWADENNIELSSINLYKFNKDSWDELSIRMVDQDLQKYYFETDLPIEPLGPMAVSGKMGESSTINPNSAMLLDTFNFESSSTDTELLSTPVTWTGMWVEDVPGFQGIIVFVMGLVMYIIVRSSHSK